MWERSINLIPMAMKATLGHGPPLQVFGTDYPTPDGTCIRDYIHVDDLADAHVRALDYLAGGGATVSLNVGTGVGTSVLEVIETTERIADRPVPHEIVARRPGDPVATYADPTRIARHARVAVDEDARRHHRHGVGVAQHPPARLRRRDTSRRSIEGRAAVDGERRPR